MSTLLRPAPVMAPPSERALLARACRVELRKVLAHWRTRLALAACALGPLLFATVVPSLGSLPTDTLFGRWLQDSGLATPLVVLSFAGGWALPLLTALVAGDIFAMEDRLGTWRSLLVAAGSSRRVFVAKALVAASYTVSVVILLAVSSGAGGLLLVGHGALPALDGRLMPVSQALPLVTACWASVLLPALAFAAVGLLCSVAFGRSPLGLGLPVLLALVQQVAALVPMPAALRVALPGHAFESWRGLLTEPQDLTAVLAGSVVSIAWAAAATAMAYRLFRARDFATPAFDGVGARAAGSSLAALVAVVVVAAGLVAAVTGQRGDGIDRRQVESSITAVFANLYVLQQRELANPPVTVAGIGASASCDKGGQDVADRGPGNDWRCVLTWHVAGGSAPARAIYQLDVSADGRYVADGDGPKEVNGWFTVATPGGVRANPLWQLDGLVDLFSTGTT
ncbi:MAG TPA: ABC transporter permease [Motilibacteraceae bacterium]|nr:ABC transporter permease [Motilibacteraceae bacterium]